MRPRTFGPWPSVHPLDGSAALRTFAGAAGGARFREAVVDYGTLLGGAAGILDPFAGSCLRRWADRWSGRALGSLTGADVREYLADLAARGHPTPAILREKNLLGSFYRWARRCGWAKDDPTRDVGAIRPFPDHPSTAWSASEQRRLLDTCRGFPSRPGGGPPPREVAEAPPPYLYPLVLLGLRTGLHMGGLLDLEWRHVDFARERIVVPARETRTGRPIDAPLHRDAAAALAALSRKARGSGTPARRVFAAAGIPLANGRPDEHGVMSAFRRALRLAGIPEGDFGSLRRSFVLNCASAGVPMEDAARMCGWDEPGLLLETYEEGGARPPSR
jgi:integrase